MKKTYHIVSRDAQSAAAALEQFTQANGQFLLPLVELITRNTSDPERTGSGR